MKNHTVRKTPGHERHAPKHKPPTPDATPLSPPTFDVERWKAYWPKLEEAEAHIKDTRAAFRSQPERRQVLEAYRRAVADKYALQREMFIYQHGHPPKDENAYGWEIAQASDLFFGGDVGQLEAVIKFLESDPWFHRSGYLKEKLTHAIKPEMLSGSDAERLRRVCLSIVDRRDTREFRSYCKLARKLGTPELRQELTRRLDAENADVRRRARWILTAL